MVLSGGIIAICLASDDNARWVYWNGWTLAIPAIIIALTCQIAIYCCKSVRRKVPINYVLLFLFTLCFGYFAG